MQKHSLKPKIFTAAIILALVACVFLLVFKREPAFVKKCKELDGKAFNFENFQTLNGYIGLTENEYSGDKQTSRSFGFYPFEKEYFDKYLQGEYILFNDDASPFRNIKLIAVFKSNNSFLISERQNVDNTWTCSIIPNENKSLMKTLPHWQND